MTSLSLWLTVGGAIAFQIWIFDRTRRVGGRDFGALLEGVLNDSKRDLEERAARGEAPDWLRYLDDADRSLLVPRDRVRSFATAALAAGVGLTMATLLIEGAFNREVRDALAALGVGTGGAELKDLLPPVGGALLVSVAGVANHLILLLGLVPRLERRVEGALGVFRAKLQRASADCPPHRTFVDAVRSELATAFSEGLQRLPEAFADFGDNVAGLRESGTALAAASAEIGPMAASLTAASERFRAMPAELDEVLSQTREAWRKEIRADQQRFLEEVKDVLVGQRELLAETQRNLAEWEASRQKAQRDMELRVGNLAADVGGAVDRLPSAFSEHALKAADAMGKSLERQVANLVAELQQQVETGNDKLSEHFKVNVEELNGTFLNGTREVVRQAVGDVYDHDLFKTLVEIARGLKGATEELPGQAESFSESLRLADEKLRSALDGIGEAGDRLRQVAASTEGFERGLQMAAVKSFEPLRDDLSSFAEELRATHRRMNEHTAGLVTFIDSLITRLGRGHDPQ